MTTGNIQQAVWFRLHDGKQQLQPEAAALRGGCPLLLSLFYHPLQDHGASVQLGIPGLSHFVTVSDWVQV